MQTKKALLTLWRVQTLSCRTKYNKNHEIEIQNSMLALTYSPSCEVPSVLVSLTSVFGMGTGGPSPPKHQHRIFNKFVVIIHHGLRNNFKGN